MLLATALVSCTARLSETSLARQQNLELHMLVDQQLARFGSDDPEQRRDAIRELRFAGVSVIRPLLAVGSPEALEAVYALGWFERMSEDQKRRFCLARIRAAPVTRSIGFISSGPYTSGTSLALGTEWGQYVCRTPDFSRDIGPLVETNPIALQFAAHWGMHRDTATTLTRSDTPWAALALWQYRDPQIARTFIDSRLDWSIRERMLTWAYGVAPYPMNTSWVSGMSMDQRDAVEARNEGAWRSILSRVDDEAIDLWREQRFRESIRTLEGIIEWSGMEQEWTPGMEKPDEAVQSVLRGDLAKAVHTLVLQNRKSSLPLLRSVLKGDMLATIGMSDTQMDTWRVNDLTNVVRESIRRLESTDARLPPVRRPERVTAEWRPLSVRIAEAREAIVRDRPPTGRLAWHLFAHHRAPCWRLIYQDLPTSALLHLAEDNDALVSEFAQAQLHFRGHAPESPK